MEEEMIRQKYRSLQNRLYTIQDKLEDLCEEMNVLHASMKQSIMIDNQIVEEEPFAIQMETVDAITTELGQVLIPMVNNKI